MSVIFQEEESLEETRKGIWNTESRTAFVGGVC